MAETISISANQAVTIPLSFSDLTGPLPTPSSGGSVSVDHPEVLTAYLTPDDQFVVIVPVTTGSAIVTYTNTDGVTDTLTVTVTNPIPSSVIFLTGTAVVTPKVNKWNGAFSSDFDISNNGKTATTNIINHTSTILGTFPRFNEKVYFEMVSGPSSAGLYYGLGTAVIASNTLLGVEGHGIALREDGHWFYNNGDLDSGIGPINNLHLGFAVDLNIGRIYVRDLANPTVWFGAGFGADPVAATGGVAFTPFAAPVFTAFCSNQNGTPQACTVLSRSADFVSAPPAGYVAFA